MLVTIIHKVIVLKQLTFSNDILDVDFELRTIV